MEHNHKTGIHSNKEMHQSKIQHESFLSHLRITTNKSDPSSWVNLCATESTEFSSEMETSITNFSTQGCNKFKTQPTSSIKMQ